VTDTLTRVRELDNAGPVVVVTSLSSDSHTWNLVFLQLQIEELGYRVVNLGPCVPDELLVSRCRDIDPALIVVSSVNGHGYQDGLRAIRRLRSTEGLGRVPVVIGGKLGVTGGEDASVGPALVEAGFDAVFEDGPDSLAVFRDFVLALPGTASVAASVSASVSASASGSVSASDVRTSA
jgi:methylaspartate mutase sigma subunit